MLAQHPPPQHPSASLFDPQVTSTATTSRQRQASKKKILRAMDRLQKPSSSRDADSSSSKVGRLSKACDGCSARKVRCDEEGPPCRACRSLNIPCTFNRPTRRRGPPNKYAMSLERRRVSPSPASVTSSETAASSSPVTLASICPSELLSLMLYDFFTYLYPLIPLPHEPWFRAQLSRTREPRFLSLVAAIVGVVAASHPRQTARHLEDLDLTYLYTNSFDFAQKCITSALDARGGHILSSPDLSIWDAITSFFLGRTYSIILKPQIAGLYLGESLNILRTLGHDHGFSDDTPTMLPGRINFLTQQMGRRLYWALFKIARANVVLGSTEGLGRLVLDPPTPYHKHPPLAETVDDDFISPDSIAPQPEGTLPAIAGFNATVQIFFAHDAIAAVDLSYAIEGNVDYSVQSKVLARSIVEVEHALGQIPDDYSLASGSNVTLESILVNEYAQDSSTRHAIAIALQRADIHISYLTTRSYIFEKFWSTGPSSGGVPPEESVYHAIPCLQTYHQPAERLSIARELHRVLETVPILLLEGFACHVGRRVRQIASTLLPYTGGEGGQSTPIDVPPDFAREATGLVRSFMAFLMRLDQSRHDNGLTAVASAAAAAAEQNMVWGGVDDFSAYWSESLSPWSQS